MAEKVLIAYGTNSGSTKDVAETIGDTLRQNGSDVDVKPFKDVGNVGSYSAVVVGGPMIVGWQKKAVKFLRQNQEVLSRIPVAYCFMSLELIRTDQAIPGDIPVFIDPGLGNAPDKDAKLSFKEKHATVLSYLKPALKKASKIKPVSVGFFAGKLDYRKLKLIQMLFVMLVIGAKPGDFRNDDAIREWASSLKPLFAES